MNVIVGRVHQSGFSCGFAAIHLLPHPAGCKFIGSINLVGRPLASRTMV